MSSITEYNRYRISQVNFDFEKLKKGKNNIKVEIQVAVRIPDDLSEKRKTIVEIVSLFSINEQDEILKIKIQGEFLVSEGILDRDKVEESLEQESVPFLYSKLQHYLDDLLKLSQINFISMPPYEENEFN